MRVRIPRHRRGTHRQRYVSPATQSIAVTISQGGRSRADNFNLTPAANPKCTPGPVVCSLTLSIAPGNAVLSFATYDGLLDSHGNPTGNELSAHQSVGVTVARGKPNTLNVTLDGIPASVAIVAISGSALAGDQVAGYTASKCFAHAVVGVLGVDADGNVILGAGAPSAALVSKGPQLAVSGPSQSAPNDFTITSPSLPNPNSTVQLTASATPASGSGGSTKTATFAVTFNSDICGKFAEYPIPTSGGSPIAIAPASDGALWFAEFGGAGKVGRVTTDGTVTEPVTLAHGEESSIAEGPDGNMYLTEEFANRIAQVFVAGGVPNEQLIPTASSHPYAIARGPDDALWFTEYNGNKVGRVDTGLGISDYAVPTAASHPTGIAMGPDGNLWFVECSGDKIAEVTTAGAFSEYLNPLSSAELTGITAGPGNAMWYTGLGDGTITKFPVTAASFSIASVSGAPDNIALGPDGALWFTDQVNNVIGRYDGSFAVKTFSVPTASSGPSGIVTGPDGAIWFTEQSTDKIGRLQ
ncbi:MAG: hypothetical protein JO029_03075 [Candidatus Eremiobacteraeota bacterium]|nr:hypothetical protein [Candidatus Eremiobacteraeota bacterium]